MNNKILNYAMEKSVKLTVLELKLLKDYFQMTYSENGLSLDWSLVILDNKKQFEIIEKIIETKLKLKDLLPNESTKLFFEKNEELIARYIDRNDQGQPIFNTDGSPKITEMLIEYQEEEKKLKETYPNVSEYNEETEQLALAEEIECVLVLPQKFSGIPKEIPPIVLSVLEKLY